MKLANQVEQALWDEYESYKNVKNYVEKWHEYDEQNYNWENFRVVFKEEDKIDLNSTLHSMPGDILLKVAIDLGVDTPDFIPSIPKFKNELKSEYTTAYDTFMKSFRLAETDPSTAIGLANSALESIVKEILTDERISKKNTKKESCINLAISFLRNLIYFQMIVLKKLKPLVIRY